eukprot:CAMPEP_0183294760 /NCGR_PEP_ID=MMETSP0160_2-20130417/2961_1 /TAXON_ID=2839 ORGANISM="Odontella Sinensis, Strain Grunow 1884" /NCGR_SAMPLE_ID=MMETSP0160_2 /ASSEMBLY_ACC=CAM_ASM_000250 /LENGTH=39 /DNA_ID= /DNA_START= /DNA_END= /DNA_ORIENTATION=
MKQHPGPVPFRRRRVTSAHPFLQNFTEDMDLVLSRTAFD